MAIRAKQQLTGKRMNAVIIQPMKQDTDTTLITGGVGNGPGGYGTSATGTLGDTSTAYAGYLLADGVAYVGFVEDVEFDQEYESEEATMLGQAHAHEISGVHRLSCTLTEVLQYRGGNFLQQAFNNTVSHNDGDDAGARIAQVVVRRAGKSFTFVGNLRTYRESYRARGKSVGVLTITGIDPVGALTAQPTIASYTQNSGTHGL
jgi:hypothetical protein